MSATPTPSWPSRTRAAFPFGIFAALVPLHAGATPRPSEPPAIRADPISVPADAPRLSPPNRPPQGAKQGVVFVNFDGANLQYGNDDATQNRTFLSDLACPYAPYGEGNKREAVMQAVRTDWAAYAVLITDARPASGPYVMNMTGPSTAFPSNVLGIAPLDCYDSQTHSNVTYAFHSVDDPHSATTTATTISQEVAHSFGLEHVADPDNIMNPSNAGVDPSFKDQCTPLTGNVVCGQQHEAHCGSPFQQNSHAELLELFGPAIADTASPLVSIVAPIDGDAFEPGASFDIVVEAGDDADIESVELLRDGALIAETDSAPYAWPVEGIEVGSYTLVARATDLAGNVGESPPITFTVGAPGSGVDTDDGETDGHGTGGLDTDDGVPAGATDDAFPALPQGGVSVGFGSADVDGCACVSGRNRAPLGTLSILLLALVRERRRR